MLHNVADDVAFVPDELVAVVHVAVGLDLELLLREQGSSGSRRMASRCKALREERIEQAAVRTGELKIFMR